MENKTYIISCADWSTVVTGASAEDACTKAFESMLRTKGKDLEVSSIMKSTCITDISQDFDLDQYTELVSCSRVLSNAGFHESAKSLNKIINNENIRN